MVRRRFYSQRLLTRSFTVVLNLNESGPLFGYHPNASKSGLLVKPEHINNAKLLFHDHNLSIVTDGACVLSAPVGSSEFVTS